MVDEDVSCQRCCSRPSTMPQHVLAWGNPGKAM